MMDYSQISNDSDLKFARRLITEYGVAAIPPSALYHQKIDNKVLKEVLERAYEETMGNLKLSNEFSSIRFYQGSVAMVEETLKLIS